MAVLPGESSKSVQKEKPPLGLHRRGFRNFGRLLLFSASTYLLRALVGVLRTSTTRTTGTTRIEMTSATVAITKAMSNPKTWASNEGMVVKVETSERKAIRNESARKHNPFVFRAIAHQRPSPGDALTGRKYAALQTGRPGANIHAASRAYLGSAHRTIHYNFRNPVNATLG